MELLHTYALDLHGNHIYPSDATTGGEYFDSLNQKLIFRAENSTLVQPHFSYPPNFDGQRTESNTVHTAAIEFIQSSGYLELDYEIIKPAKIVTEKATISGTRYIPDLTFYDAYGNILCLVEVVVTHKCEPEKIEAIKQRNILTYEITYENDHENFKGYHRFGNSQITASELCIGKEKTRIYNADATIRNVKSDIRYYQDSIEQKQSFDVEIRESCHDTTERADRLETEIERERKRVVPISPDRVAKFERSKADVRKQIDIIEERIEIYDRNCGRADVEINRLRTMLQDRTKNF